MLPLMPLLLALTPQQTQIAADVELPGCTLTRCWGKRIAHTVGMFRLLRSLQYEMLASG